jgi:galactofuranosylgalactofuranosylrhamnosyl-N-acetylglucosaminyl-diphospho-decaprenol beta-1,5/1,6-galactofuranosyltransferase
VVVVDQGSRKVRDDPAFPAVARTAGHRLTVLDQDNFGGAGGFTRCLLEALDTDGATHALLMDDDAILEPESVLRAAAFLALARDDLAVGGQMLDQSRPRELVEAGSRYLPERITTSPHVRRRVDRPTDLAPLLTNRQQVDYNGWWFFAFPLALLDRVGLPLPLFLRGDDVELGYRFLRAGVPTVSLPGVAVWHEPFEAKERGWHAYYDLRNMLAVGALHFPAPRPLAVARRFLHRLLDELLTYDYAEAWLMCEAVADFLRGPQALRARPQPAHLRLLAGRDKLAPAALRRGGLPAASPSPASRRRLVRWAHRLRLLVRNLVRPSPPADAMPRHALQVDDETAQGVGRFDVVAVDSPYQTDLVVLRRSRGHFLRLFLRGLGLGLRLVVAHGRAARRWREGAPALTTRQFWSAYLSLPPRLPLQRGKRGRSPHDRAQAP